MNGFGVGVGLKCVKRNAFGDGFSERYGCGDLVWERKGVDGFGRYVVLVLVLRV